MSRLTEEEYYDNLRDIVRYFDSIPHVRNFITSYSYEHGHSGGYEEILIIAQDLVCDLKAALIKDGLLIS